MTLIKSSRVYFAPKPRTLGSAAPPTDAPSAAAIKPVAAVNIDPQLQTFDAEIKVLRQKLQASLAKVEEQEVAIDDAYERGIGDGARNVTLQTAASIELLSDGIDRAIAQLAQYSSAMEQLAVELARTALTRVFGERSHRPDMVLEIIHRQLETLAKDMVLQIDVASKDFKDAADQDDAFAAWLQQGISIQRRDDLVSGDCEMHLRLGTLDIGLDQQWGKIRAHLEQLNSEASQ
jgi:flagellar biosynthesis/type III secretory pathway protein FliH